MNSSSEKPFILHIEGTDCSGKTFLANELVKQLQPTTIVSMVPEFSKTELGEMFDDIVERKQFISIGDGEPLAETLALIADHFLKTQSALSSGAMLAILDRGDLSIAAYQGLRLEADPKYKNQDWSRKIWGFLRLLPMPNLVAILTVTEDQIISRMTRRGDRISPDGINFILTAQERLLQESSHLPRANIMVLENGDSQLEANIRAIKNRIQAYN